MAVVVASSVSAQPRRVRPVRRVWRVPRARTAWRARLALGLLLAFAACVSVPLASAQRADASPTHPATAPRLVVTADPANPHFLVSPGEPAYWRVTGALDGLPEATLTLQVTTSGALAKHPLGLRMLVQQCADAWTSDPAPTCAAGAQTVATTTPAQAGTVVASSFRFQPLRENHPEYLLVTLSVADTAVAGSDRALMGLTGNFGVGLTAMQLDGAPLRVVAPVGASGGPDSSGGSAWPVSSGSRGAPGAPGAPGFASGILAMTGTTISRLIVFAAALALILGSGCLWAGARRRRGEAR